MATVTMTSFPDTLPSLTLERGVGRADPRPRPMPLQAGPPVSRPLLALGSGTERKATPLRRPSMDTLACRQRKTPSSCGGNDGVRSPNHCGAVEGRVYL
jgi:hypothetical protein